MADASLHQLTDVMARLEPVIAQTLTLAEALPMLTGEAVTLIDGAECAGITLRQSGQFETVAATSDLAVQVDAIQYQLGTGPCVDAVTNNRVYLTDDLAHDTRWPTFGPVAARQTEVRSMLSCRLLLPSTSSLSAGLNFYSRQREAFALPARTLGILISTYAALIMANARQAEEIVNLHRALESNRDIGTAMGILMALQKITKEQAFGVLRVASQHSHRKLATIATEVIETGTTDGSMTTPATPKKRTPRHS